MTSHSLTFPWVNGLLLFYAPTIPAAIHPNLPFVQFVPSPQEALAVAKARAPQHANVLVFPYGGSTYPILPGK